MMTTLQKDRPTTADRGAHAYSIQSPSFIRALKWLARETSSSQKQNAQILLISLQVIFGSSRSKHLHQEIALDDIRFTENKCHESKLKIILF